MQNFLNLFLSESEDTSFTEGCRPRMVLVFYMCGKIKRATTLIALPRVEDPVLGATAMHFRAMALGMGKVSHAPCIHTAPVQQFSLSSTLLTGTPCSASVL